MHCVGISFPLTIDCSCIEQVFGHRGGPEKRLYQTALVLHVSDVLIVLLHVLVKHGIYMYHAGPTSVWHVACLTYSTARGCDQR